MKREPWVQGFPLCFSLLFFYAKKINQRLWYFFLVFSLEVSYKKLGVKKHKDKNSGNGTRITLV